MAEERYAQRQRGEQAGPKQEESSASNPAAQALARLKPRTSPVENPQREYETSEQQDLRRKLEERTEREKQKADEKAADEKRKQEDKDRFDSLVKQVVQAQKEFPRSDAKKSILLQEKTLLEEIYKDVPNIQDLIETNSKDLSDLGELNGKILATLSGVNKQKYIKRSTNVLADIQQQKLFDPVKHERKMKDEATRNKELAAAAQNYQESRMDKLDMVPVMTDLDDSKLKNLKDGLRKPTQANTQPNVGELNVGGPNVGGGKSRKHYRRKGRKTHKHKSVKKSRKHRRRKSNRRGHKSRRH